MMKKITDIIKMYGNTIEDIGIAMLLLLGMLVGTFRIFKYSMPVITIGTIIWIIIALLIGVVIYIND